MPSIVNKVSTDGTKIFFVPSGSGQVGETAGGETASFVVTMSGATSTGSALTADSLTDTGSFWSFRTPDEIPYKVFYVSSSGRFNEPSASQGLPNFTPFNTQTGGPIKVVLDGEALADKIAESTANAIISRPGLPNKLTVSHSFVNDERGHLLKAFLHVNFKQRGQLFFNAHSSSLSLTGLYTSGSSPSTHTWSTGSGTVFQTTSGSGVFPALPSDGLPNPASASGIFELSGSDNGLKIKNQSSQLYLSASGLIGIGTDNPKKAFDIKDETPGKAEFVVRKSLNPDEGESGEQYQIGDEIGMISFVADSGSFGEDDSSGSISQIVAKISHIDANGLRGNTVIRNFRDSLTAADAITTGYGLLGGAKNETAFHGAILTTGSIFASGSFLSALGDGQITASNGILTNSHLTAHSITSSTTVSASTTVMAAKYRINQIDAITNTGGNTHLFPSTAVTNMDVGVQGALRSFKVNSLAVVATGDISSSGHINTDSHITASGNISSSGNVKGLVGEFKQISNYGGGQDLDIVATDDIRLRAADNVEIRPGDALKSTFFAEGGFRVNSNSSTVPTSTLDVNGDITATTHITASNVSASGVVSAGTYRGTWAGDTLTVAEGGTGRTTFANKSVIISQDSGTDILSAAQMASSGQILIGGTSGPAVNTLTAGTNITITNGDGTIRIDAAGGGTTVTKSAEEIQDIVGAMFTSNTEVNITASYEDSDGTMDLIANPNIRGFSSIINISALDWYSHGVTIRGVTSFLAPSQDGSGVIANGETGLYYCHVHFPDGRYPVNVTINGSSTSDTIRVFQGDFGGGRPTQIDNTTAGRGFPMNSTQTLANVSSTFRPDRHILIIQAQVANGQSIYGGKVTMA